MYRICMVEDDPLIAKKVKNHLESWDYEGTLIEDFSNVMAEVEACNPHLILMDIKLPSYNGYYWCQEIRKTSKVPIMFLSSASDNMNIVMAVNMGGDDFLAKPFDLDVLTVKIQAMLRRSYDFVDAGDTLEYRGMILNLGDATVLYNGNRVELTRNELKILQTLLENKGKIVTRDILMTKIWESDDYIDENTLSVNVNRLRKKLAEMGLEELIVTKKGMGYKLG
ncbi:MAG: response regulator transcription factor [Agathobacter sp.]|nr:response regulator transcription factor [Agathobacter sp.]